MSSKTKIFVFKSKELIYTAIFAGLAILLIVLLVLMFAPKKETEHPSPSESTTAESAYIPGVYTTAMKLSDQSLNMVVCVDANHINRIYLENLEEAVETLYPLVPSALASLSSQILSSQSLESVTYNTASQYTSELLLTAISQSLEKALAP